MVPIDVIAPMPENTPEAMFDAWPFTNAVAWSTACWIRSGSRKVKFCSLSQAMIWLMPCSAWWPSSVPCDFTVGAIAAMMPPRMPKVAMSVMNTASAPGTLWFRIQRTGGHSTVARIRASRMGSRPIQTHLSR